LAMEYLSNKASKTNEAKAAEPASIGRQHGSQMAAVHPL